MHRPRAERVRILLVGLLVSGCTAPEPSVPSATITVGAAASLAGVLPSLVNRFAALHPEIRVRVSLAGSPTLLEQLRGGAPLDLFLSAGDAPMEEAVREGWVSAPLPFAHNLPALIVPSGNPAGIHALADLTRTGVVVALCQKEVPCGRVAHLLLEEAGVPVPRATIEPDVGSVRAKVLAGEADAGIVYRTDLRAGTGTLEEVPLPEGPTPTTRYSAAVARNTPQEAAAARFRDFLSGAEGQALLADAGFLPPDVP